MTETPSTLSILRDVANGKRRAFYPDQPVSAEAAAMFKDWFSTEDKPVHDLELDPMPLLEINPNNLHLGAVGWDPVSVQDPWTRNGRRRKPTTEEQVLFLMAKTLVAPNNGLLRLCPWCGDLFVAGRSDKEYCSRGCKSRALSGEFIKNMQAEIKAERVRLCKEAYPKYKGTKEPLTNTAKYVNTHRPEGRRLQDWGLITKNFVSHNFKEIGIRESELKEAKKKEAEATKLKKMKLKKKKGAR
jgi:hypothetical protein